MTALEKVDNYPIHKEKILPKDKQAILKTLGYLSLKRAQYFVIGGANMVLRGIKNTTPDLDMLVSEGTFNWLAKRRGAEIHTPPLRAQYQGADNSTVWVKNARTPVPISATTALGDGYYPMSFESHKSETELINGVNCLRLEHVRAAKEALQRPKDIMDLEDIAIFLGENLDLPEPTIKDPLPFSS